MAKNWGYDEETDTWYDTRNSPLAVGDAIVYSSGSVLTFATVESFGRATPKGRGSWTKLDKIKDPGVVELLSPYANDRGIVAFDDLPPRSPERAAFKAAAGDPTIQLQFDIGGSRNITAWNYDIDYGGKILKMEHAR